MNHKNINNNMASKWKCERNDGKDSRSDDRWLSHANRKYGEIKDWLTTRSDGCDIESYINHQALFEIFKKWNISDNYQIRTQLINQKYGGYWWEGNLFLVW